MRESRRRGDGLLNGSRPFPPLSDRPRSQRRAILQPPALCSQLGYDQDQFEAMMAEAVETYQSDRGRALIEQILADDS